MILRVGPSYAGPPVTEAGTINTATTAINAPVGASPLLTSPCNPGTLCVVSVMLFRSSIGLWVGNISKPAGAKEIHIAIVEPAPRAGRLDGRGRAMSFAGDKKRLATGASTS